MKQFLLVAAVAVMPLLQGCAPGDGSTNGQALAQSAGVISSEVLPAGVEAKLRQLCANNATALNAPSSPALPAKVSTTASYPTAYCQGLGQLPPSQVPATTNSGTASWLPGAIALAGELAKAAAIIVPLVL